MAYSTQDISSSPDPLNDTPTFSSPMKDVIRSGRSLSLPGSSPRKQTFELDVGNNLSPQKIRVTVEAESNKENSYIQNEINMFSPSPYYAPTMRQNERTRTTTVPLKGLSDSDNDLPNSVTTPKRGRGRPRKSTGTPIPGKSKVRNPTPNPKSGPKRQRTVADLVDGDDEGQWDFAIGSSVDVRRRKGRSRSRSIKSSNRPEITSGAKTTSSPAKAASSSAGQGLRRKRLLSESVRIHEDIFDESAGAHDNRVEDETDRALEAIHVNRADIPSSLSSIRSTTTIDNGSGDTYVHLAKHTLPNKSTARTRWSSPQVSSIVSEASARFENHSRESTPMAVSSHEELAGQVEYKNTQLQYSETHHCGKKYDDENVPSPNENRVSHTVGDEDFQEEFDDNLGEMHEFDTIMESEEFSMISVESVQSLREHFTTPALQTEPVPAPAPTVAPSKDLPLIKTNPAFEDSFSSVAPDVLDAATPGRTRLGSNLRTVMNANANDSFSSVAPEILNAATPRTLLPQNRFLAVKSPARTQFEDSFSTIPPEILEAASPIKSRPNVSGSLNEQIEDLPAMADSTLPVPAEPSVISSGRPRASSRLLTPDKTPSPSVEGLMPDSGKIESHHATIEESSILSQMRSSPPPLGPPRYTYTAHLRDRKAMYPLSTQTPSIVFSSPVLPPPKQRPETKASNLSTGSSTVVAPLSPIVRAGLALQDIVVPSSSSNHSASLRSPFKSPSARRSSVTEPGSESRAEDLQDHQARGNLGEVFRSHDSGTGTMKWRGSLQEDPFGGYSPAQTRPASPEEKQNYVLALPKQNNSLQNGSPNQRNSQAEASYDDSAMSWQAGYPVPEKLPLNDIDNTDHYVESPDTTQYQRSGFGETTEIRVQRRENEWAQERAAVRQQIDAASTSQVIVLDADESYSSESIRSQSIINHSVAVADDMDDGEDIWQAEARDSSSLLKGKDRDDKKKEVVAEKPKRSKIPSPWRINSKRLVYSDELSQLSPVAKSPELEPVPDRKLHLTTQPDFHENVDAAAEQNLLVPKTRTSIQVPRSLSQRNTAVEVVADLSMEWHIPQKSNFAPLPRQRASRPFGLPALLKSSPVKPNAASSLFANPKYLLFGTSSVQRPEPARQNSFDDTAENSPFDTLDETRTDDLSSSIANSSGVGYADSASNDYDSDENHRACNRTPDRSRSGSETNDNSYSTATPTCSPRKSCLRTPANPSPSKSVIFATVNPSPLPPSPRLSSTTWSKAHWLMLDGIYQDAKTGTVVFRTPSEDDSTQCLEDSMDSVQRVMRSPYLGMTIISKGISLVLEAWHLHIVSLFCDVVPGWEEGIIAKRLFALIVGEEKRRIQREKEMQNV